MVDLVEIGPAKPEDTFELAVVGYTAWEFCILPLFTETRGMRETQQRRINNYVRECFERIIVARLDGEIIGWTSHARERPYIPFLFVLPDMQGQGVGAALLGRMEAMLELRGFDRVFLETPAEHLGAVGFYRHRGYDIWATNSDQYAQDENQVSIRLGKTLQPYKGEIDAD